jgi:hypothetical protein
MSIKVDWTFLVQSRIKKNLGEWFAKHEVETYDDAVQLLEKSHLPVGNREEVVKHLPVRPEINDLLFDSGSTTSSVTGRLAKKKVDKGPKSAAEEAADAITASSATNVNKSTKSTKTRPTTKKRATKSPRKKSLK